MIRTIVLITLLLTPIHLSANDTVSRDTKPKAVEFFTMFGCWDAENVVELVERVNNGEIFPQVMHSLILSSKCFRYISYRTNSPVAVKTILFEVSTRVWSVKHDDWLYVVRFSDNEQDEPYWYTTKDQLKEFLDLPDESSAI